VRNWVSSDADLDEPVNADDDLADTPRVSAGQSSVVFFVHQYSFRFVCDTLSWVAEARSD